MRQQDRKDKTYYFTDGIQELGLKKVGEKWYYFTEDGKNKTGLIKDGDKFYYITADGKSEKVLITEGEKVYFINEDGSLKQGFVEVNGKKVQLSTYEAKAGWDNYDGKWYYFDSAGKMLTGWIQTNKWYYIDDNGVMQTGWKFIKGS